MHYDFSTVQDIESFASIPEGIRLCRVAEIREGHSRDGSIQWNFRLEAADGEHAGRTAAWDSLTWSERGVHRVKHVLDAFGFDVRGEIEVDAEELIGRFARVELILEEREDPLRNRRVVRLRVPYLGYGPDNGPGNGPGNGSGNSSAVDAWGGEEGSSRDDPFEERAAGARRRTGDAG